MTLPDLCGKNRVETDDPDIREMRKQGLRPFLVGAVGELVIAGLTLGLVLGASRFIL